MLFYISKNVFYLLKNGSKNYLANFATVLHMTNKFRKNRSKRSKLTDRQTNYVQNRRFKTFN